MDLSTTSVKEARGAPALLPLAVALLHRQDPHERFHGLDLSVVDLERLPHRQLIAAALAYAPGHAQQHDAHALIHGDAARLYVTEALEDREQLRGDVLAARGELAVRPGHHLAVLVAIGSCCRPSCPVHLMSLGRTMGM